MQRLMEEQQCLTGALMLELKHLRGELQEAKQLYTSMYTSDVTATSKTSRSSLPLVPKGPLRSYERECSIDFCTIT